MKKTKKKKSPDDSRVVIFISNIFSYFVHPIVCIPNGIARVFPILQNVIYGEEMLLDHDQ